DTSHYTLELPDELKRRNIHLTFHASLLKPHEPNDELLFPNREAKRFYDFGMPEDLEWQVEEIVGHKWEGNQLSYLIHWTAGEYTWEPSHECEDLQALDDYLALLGVREPSDLPR
ncbi:hypothetical protein OH76DRAFT_1326703, partial [Lentinus brumalis]